MRRGQVKVIGGKWRSRKLDFPALPSVRPTPNRIRETLFNWLAPTLPASACLDLFAGSGALGFEALSRGAQSVVFVEAVPLLVRYLKKEITRFATTDHACVYGMQFPFTRTCTQMLKTKHAPFDIIFLDPPFHKNLVSPLCHWLIQEKLLSPKARVYIEMEASSPLPPLGTSWMLAQHKKAGQVSYSLLEIIA